MALSIWHLCSNRWNSAIAEYAINAARALALAGSDTLFIAKLGTPAATRAAALQPTRTVRDFTWRGLLDLLALMRKNPPDIIITYGGPETFLAGFLKAVHPTKVLRFQGQALSPKPFHAARHRLAHRHVDLILTPSETLAAAVRRLRPWQPVVSVPLGCDADRYCRSLDILPPRARPEMLIFGRLDPVKGHRAMIARFALLLAAWESETPRPCLHIIGEAANLSVAELEDCVLAHGLRWGSDVVVTARRIDDVPAVLSSACLGVIPSLGSELICRVAEEFLLCGTPVAVSGVGSLEEVLFPGAGFSFGEMNNGDMIDAFRHWIQLSVTEGAQAKARRAAVARRYFSLEAMANALTNTLRRL